MSARETTHRGRSSMKCSNCGYENAADSNYCTYCNHVINPAKVYATASPTATQATASTAPPTTTQATTTASSSYQPPYYYYQPSNIGIKEKQPFSVTDVYIIIGFVLAIIGIFAYSFLLLPTSIGFSVVGFVKRTNARTLGLSIAGIVVGVVACLIKIGMVLHELGFIPEWLSAGIF